MISEIEREVIVKMFSIKGSFAYMGSANIEGYFMGWLSCNAIANIESPFYNVQYLDLIKDTLYDCRN